VFYTPRHLPGGWVINSPTLTLGSPIFRMRNPERRPKVEYTNNGKEWQSVWSSRIYSLLFIYSIVKGKGHEDHLHRICSKVHKIRLQLQQQIITVHKRNRKHSQDRFSTPTWNTRKTRHRANLQRLAILNTKNIKICGRITKLEATKIQFVCDISTSLKNLIFNFPR